MHQLGRKRDSSQKEKEMRSLFLARMKVIKSAEAGLFHKTLPVCLQREKVFDYSSLQMLQMRTKKTRRQRKRESGCGFSRCEAFEMLFPSHRLQHTVSLPSSLLLREEAFLVASLLLTAASPLFSPRSSQNHSAHSTRCRLVHSLFLSLYRQRNHQRQASQQQTTMTKKMKGKKKKKNLKKSHSIHFLCPAGGVYCHR